MSKHTPGPWKVSGWRVCAFPERGIKVICDTANNNATRNDENASNARLIAAAPEMYDLLKEIDGHGTLRGDMPKRLAELLKKVEGE